MRLLVFGETGQLARELARRCPPDVEASFVGRVDAELSEPSSCAAAIIDSAADVVINAAAWTAVDLAEAEEAAATVANGAAPGAMARACAAKGIPFLHVSTDYVFDGAGDAPFAPGHAPAPLNAYGSSKHAGEAAVRASGARHVILRTSWVFSGFGNNFLKSMLRLGREREALKVVSDQVGGPTPAAALADALYAAARAMTRGQPGGTYHFSGAPDVSWAEFARAIMVAAGLSCRIEDIVTADYPTAARRPLNSRLDCSRFTRDFGMNRPDWRKALNDILKELGATA
jgi:dTDP-4-dehydrorhamnose reductase